MLTEDYVSYEVAKLLKEKGFPFMCSVGSLWVDKQGKTKLHSTFAPITWVNEDDDDTPAVSQALAMKRIREKHGLHISADPHLNEEGEVTWMWKIINIETATVIADSLDGDDFNSCEEAVDAALKYCLTELI